MVLADRARIYWPAEEDCVLEDNFLITETGNEKMCNLIRTISVWQTSQNWENRN